MSEPANPEVEILNKALELDPDERSAYLELACAGNAPLRQRVEELLKAHEQAEDFLEAPPAGLAIQRTLLMNLPLSEKPGDKIGRYKLLQQIGEGGCGVVYMAEQEEPVRRRVALKVIKLGMDTKGVIARFEAERQALALMDHPNIAKVLDAGATDTGRPYFVMELVRGIKITDYCDEHEVSTEDRLKLFIQVCKAVQHAHQKGIIHRDLKPSNILVTVNDGAPVPKVIDFGIAKATQGRLTDKTLFTAFEQFIGTPAYMSPEQAVMTSLDIDTRSDIYSLGVLLYELLTGKTPFDQKELLAAGLDEMCRTIREIEPPKPSTRLTQELVAADVRRLHSKSEVRDPKSEEQVRASSSRLLQVKELIHVLRGDLDWIVMKCLEKDRSRRYETANGLARDIERHLNNEPVIARPPSRLYEFQKTVRRHKFGFAAGAAVITALAIGVAVSTCEAIRITREHRAATEKLFDSYLAQARARRRDSTEGQRFESLETVRKAAAIHSSLELRNEAIACLAMADVRFSDAQESPDGEGECWSANLQLRAYRKPAGIISVRRTRDNSEVALLPSLGAGALAPYGFSPDGRYLAVTYANDRHVVWDVGHQQLAITNIPHARSADFSSDGKTVAFPCADGQLRRFGLNPIRPLPSIAANPRYHSIRLRSQGDWFAGYESGKAGLEVCDLRDGSLVRTLSHRSLIGTFAWSSDGRYLAVGCEDGRIFIWNALTGEKQAELEGHEDDVVSVGWSHSGWLLGSSSWDGQFRLWDLAAGRILLTTAGWSYQTMFSADDRRIGRVQRGAKSGALEVTTSSVFQRLSCKKSPNRGSLSTDVSPDGRLVAAAFNDGVHIWADWQTEEPFVLPVPQCYSVIFTPDGTNVITCGRSGVARWPMQRIPGASTDELRIGPRQSIREGNDFNFAALSGDGNWLAAADWAAEGVSIFEVRNPTNHFRLVSQPHIQFPAISPDGRWVAAGNFKGAGVKVWDFDSRQVICTLPTPSTASVSFSPDNRWLAVSGVNFDLWETGTWKRNYTIHRDRPDVAASLAFSPDGRTLAIADGPGLVHLVATDSGEVLANLEAPRAALISFLRFSPDGAQLFALEWDQQIQVWELRALRSELTKLNLDWNAPPIPGPPAGPATAKPLRISLAESVSP